MPTENYQIVIGLVVSMIVLLIAVSFIFILVTYAGKRKRRFMQEKEHLQTQFKEQLLQSQLEIQEHTFNIVSQEIHDNVGQLLSLAKLQLNIIEADTANKLPLLADAKDSVSKAMVDLRDIAKNMNADRIQNSTLPEMVDLELQRINRMGIVTAQLNITGAEVPIGEDKKLIILRIIQESLQNILKHAGAKNIQVGFDYTSANFKVEIQDDGKGFDTDAAIKKDGLGLSNIINRAALIGGNASIDSHKNVGTLITVILPYA